MENIKQMRKRHEEEIGKLQDLCKHKKSTRMLSGIKVCNQCGKILKSYPSSSTDSYDITDYAFKLVV